jgi:hypothetical protein
MEPTAIIALILTALGAVGGVLWVKGHVQNAWRHVKTRKAAPRQHSDFYYNSLEIGARIHDRGARWVVTRTATITSLQHELETVDIGVRPQDQREATYSISPAESLLLTRAGSIQGFEHFEVTPKQPLTRDERLPFVFACEFTKSSKARDFLSWESNRRVDRLLLRVVFPDDNAYRTVKAQIVSHSGRILEQRLLHPDVVTGEYRFEWLNISPAATYCIAWSTE